MLWLYLTLFAYLINAVAFVIDKYLLVTRIPRPFVYAFWVALLSSFAAVLIPFGVNLQSVEYLSVALASGASFFGALIFLYKAIKASDISVASTMSGAATAVFSYLFAVPLLGEPFGAINLAAVATLVAGMFFIGGADKKIWVLAGRAGLLFAISFVFLKMSFDRSDFINGLFWTRVGFVGVALASLASGSLRREVLRPLRGAGAPHSKIGVIFVGNKLLAAGGFLILYYAIRLGRVSVVNSLLGLQFLFIFLIALLVRRKFIEAEEHIDKKNILRKILGICFIVIGFVLVAYFKY